jgi:molybdopterin/thiamine biosynthesis adenylyltransferase
MTFPNLHDRQERIAGWNQQSIRAARVAVIGRDHLGCFLTWALGSLGVGEVLWVGRPCPRTEPMARFLLASPPPWGQGDASVYDFPFDPEYGPELDWALASPLPQLLAVVTEHPRAQERALEWARRRRVPALVGSTAGSGWFGISPPPEPVDAPRDPIRAMIVAALVVDAVRELICPLPGGMLPPEGGLDLVPPIELHSDVPILQVGVGAIGVYSAVVLSAALGPRLHLRLWDFDHVDATNLNRQGLFTTVDAHRRTPKAHAALRVLARLFPAVRFVSEIRRLGPNDAARVSGLSPRPTALLSAVDNAGSRLMLQRLGQDLSIPVIQGGTSVFAADCYTQEAGGPSLDDQMYGALGAAAEREEQTRPGRGRRGGCAADPSYIVPGMMAGALMAYRLTQLGRASGLSPFRWRSGGIPVESRSLSHVEYDPGTILV